MMHGDNMTGLHQLMTGHQNINIKSTDVENGAQLGYTTDDPTMVTTHNPWFEVLLADHGPYGQSNQ